MKLKTIFAAVTLALLPQMLQAQWRVGVNAGATYNMLYTAGGDILSP